MSGGLAGRTAIVTGGASGIGRGIALAFAEEGATVVVADVREGSRVPDDEATTTEVIERAGGEARFVRTDVTDDEAVCALVAETVDAYGGLDVLVNAAGITTAGAVHEITDEEFERIQDVNVTGVVRCCRAAIPHLLESEYGRVINVSSQRGLRGGEATEKAAYVASKGAVSALTRQMALDYGPQGIAVNAICPGPIESGMTPIESEAERERLLSGILTPFVGRPEDVAPAALLLAGDGSRFIHGHELVVDGGYLVK
ncbi:SDR family NAD(P)-dependent oxidoreductase [Natronorarus salvus]|uniref:SDR family NAD(P)-dependent oxidoreductase n=1 Tax=Natronorarus salvus TaxID=3117733 RepID=UPI002F269EB5